MKSCGSPAKNKILLKMHSLTKLALPGLRMIEEVTAERILTDLLDNVDVSGLLGGSNDIGRAAGEGGRAKGGPGLKSCINLSA